MITAIADDLTGAAELAGVGLRFGLDVEFSISVPKHPPYADLLIIATDTRAKSRKEAMTTISEIIQQLEIKNIRKLFKKTDSVLRGHVVAELEAIQAFFPKQKFLLVPCNPSLERIIKDGIYYVKNQPIHETSFVHEYHHEPQSSKVMELLHTDRQDISVLRPDQPFTSRPFVVGEAETTQQIEQWAKDGISEQRVLGGGADFFAAFLEAWGYKPRSQDQNHTYNAQGSRSPKLFVCGSASENSQRQIEQAKSSGQAVCSMPEELLKKSADTKKYIDQWGREVAEAFQQNSSVIAAIDKPLVKDPDVSNNLRRYLAALVKNVLSRVDLKELCIEGGSTAATIIWELKFGGFTPVQELAPGVIRMQVADHPNLHVTLKPGSYDWPENIWNAEKRD
ncbi:hypothetical protein NC796_12355 [Aliifodinibius sp. S!AR15-10]|uniref:four-carbon acid sugar kinase family protein n=1 Tax=Aliifodinibius sp. S!AR15-10 TaxID=2950437 RepID=UPI002856CFD6|nr:four-carbon acid sugar kinase family protein [Aliifodinibius sp. S!AR15-10]MDR8391941.1 hypothetical protein [Aliifodinibius sp. S!AR15-10]